MKKVLSLLLAVVLVCSMATVAFAADLGYGYICEVCGGTTSSAAEYNAHIVAGGCGTCAYCAQGFSAAEIAGHEYICTKANVVCDYCGDTYASNSDFDAHIEACKAKYYNIPLAKIIATVKDLVAKIDFDAVLSTVKDLAGKAVTAVKGLIGNIA